MAVHWNLSLLSAFDRLMGSHSQIHWISWGNCPDSLYARSVPVTRATACPLRFRSGGI